MIPFGIVDSKAEETDIVAIDENNFPDEVFRTYVSDNFDADDSGDLSAEEIADITSIQVNNMNITDLTGIQYFYNLSILYCWGNEITTLDVSNNTALFQLFCNSNNISSLKLGNLSNLRDLDCSSNNISSLDLANCTALQSLECFLNKLTSLDISNCTLLYYIDCSGNNISSLDISNCPDIRDIITDTELNVIDARNLSLSGDNLSYVTKRWSDGHNGGISAKLLNNTIYLSLDSSNKFDLTNWLYVFFWPTVSIEDISFVAGGTVSYNNNQLVFTLDEASEIGYVMISYTRSLSPNEPVTTSTQTLVFNYSGDITGELQPPQNGWFIDGYGRMNYYKNSVAVKSQWLQENDKWYYFDEYGYAAIGWQSIGGVWYYFGEDWAMKTGWVEIDNSWYYMNSSGAMLTGWQEINGSWYYFYDSGAMAESTWIGDSYVGSDGAWTKETVEEGWQQAGGKWWYQLPDSSYPVNEWKFIGGEWYYFDGSGYMATGWVFDGSDWYYMNPGGTMTTGWVQDAGTWYYMNTSGAMATDWVYDAGTWYYMDKSGAMKTGWVEIIEKDEEEKEYSTWYYMETSGAMKTGWLNDNGTWYYLNTSGLMVTDTVIDGCTIDENGVWVQ